MMEVARGALMYRVTLAQGRIQDYAIDAPTTWIFDSRGLAARVFVALVFEFEAQCTAQVRAQICAINPYVA